MCLCNGLESRFHYFWKPPIFKLTSTIYITTWSPGPAPARTLRTPVSWKLSAAQPSREAAILYKFGLGGLPGFEHLTFYIFVWYNFFQMHLILLQI